MNVDAIGINMSQVLNVLFKFKNVIYQNNILNSYFFNGNISHYNIICNMAHGRHSNIDVNNWIFYTNLTTKF